MSTRDTIKRVDPALAMDILATIMQTGGSLTASLRLLGLYLPGCTPLKQVSTQIQLGIDWETSWKHALDTPGLDELAEQLKFIHTSSVPSAHVLRAAASTLRRNRKRRAEQLAAELAIRLVIPMGVCLLPAFICLGVIPMVYALLPNLS